MRFANRSLQRIIPQTATAYGPRLSTRTKQKGGISRMVNDSNATEASWCPRPTLSSCTSHHITSYHTAAGRPKKHAPRAQAAACDMGPPLPINTSPLHIHTPSSQ
jgi:hypothetical protein